MTSFVLMSNRTGELCEGHRVYFVDRIEKNKSPGDVYLVILNDFHGWIVCSTEAGGFKVFMNREWVEKEFENLGTL